MAQGIFCCEFCLRGFYLRSGTKSAVKTERQGWFTVEVAVTSPKHEVRQKRGLCRLCEYSSKIVLFQTSNHSLPNQDNAGKDTLFASESQGEYAEVLLVFDNVTA